MQLVPQMKAVLGLCRVKGTTGAGNRPITEHPDSESEKETHLVFETSARKRNIFVPELTTKDMSSGFETNDKETHFVPRIRVSERNIPYTPLLKSCH